MFQAWLWPSKVRLRPWPRPSRYAEVYRADLGQSTILRKVSPEFHAAVMETGGLEAFARSSASEMGRNYSLMVYKPWINIVTIDIYYMFTINHSNYTC